MSKKRIYGEACGMAHALDLVGERWALHVVRELLLGPKRFTDLRAGISKVSPNVLSERLRELEGHGIVQRRVLGPPVGGQVYELTPWGRELEPAVQALGRWAARSPEHHPDCGMSIDSHAMAMRTMFDAERAGDLDATVALHLGDDRFVARVAAGEFSIERREVETADVVLTLEPPALAAAAFGGIPLEDLIAAGDVVLEGDRDAAERFVTLFPLPDKAPVPA